MGLDEMNDERGKKKKINEEKRCWDVRERRRGIWTGARKVQAGGIFAVFFPLLSKPGAVLL